jgi:DNA-binding MarR family transcriptional regulator
MTEDILAALGPLALGSRLKRLGERMQADAALLYADVDAPVQPAQFPLLAALDRHGPMTVGQCVERVGLSQPAVTRIIGALVAAGMATTDRDPGDGRQRRVALSPEGATLVARMKQDLWPWVADAAALLCAEQGGTLIDRISATEAALAEWPLVDRVRSALRIRDYEDGLAADFHAINAEWIEAMFVMEDADRETLLDPHGSIIEPGGAILFVEAYGLGVVGTGALKKTGPGCFELTKMGVRASARGRKAGEYLLAALIARAEAMAIEELFLLTSKKCEAAIHLYEKAGFAHDADIMQRFGARYERCDVAMRYPMTTPDR